MKLKRLWHAALDFMHPARCSSCGVTFDSTALYCDECETQMEMLVTAPRCDHCAAPLPYDSAPCPYCFGKGIGPIKSVAALGVFNEPIKSTIHHAKFHGRWPVIRLLAKRLFEQSNSQPIFHGADVLIPIPLHRTRQIERGYNQAEVLASALGQLAGKPVRHPIIRAKKTSAQTELGSRAERMENLKDAFIVVRPEWIEGKHVIIVDDVITTASTILSFARVVKSAGPQSISAAVLAIGDPKGREFETV